MSCKYLWTSFKNRVTNPHYRKLRKPRDDCVWNFTKIFYLASLLLLCRSLDTYLSKTILYLIEGTRQNKNVQFRISEKYLEISSHNILTNSTVKLGWILDMLDHSKFLIFTMPIYTYIWTYPLYIRYNYKQRQMSLFTE